MVQMAENPRLMSIVQGNKNANAFNWGQIPIKDVGEIFSFNWGQIR
jgi:hypothetical protein